MSVDVLMNQISIIFMMIAVGWIAQKTGIITESTTKVLSDLLMKIALPFTLLAATNIEGGTDAVIKMFTAFVLLTVCYMGSAGVCEWISRKRQMEEGKKAVFVVLSVFPNSGFIGIPLLSAFFGQEGILYGAAGMMAYNLLFFTYGTALFKKGEGVRLKQFITPANVATLVMIIMLMGQWRLPANVEAFCSAMGAITTPLALIVIGVMIGNIKMLAILKNKFLYFITLLRCFIFPILFTILLSFLPLDMNLRLAAVVLSACASGSLGAVLAKQMDMEAELASQAVIQTTLCLVVSMPFIIQFAQVVL